MSEVYTKDGNEKVEVMLGMGDLVEALGEKTKDGYFIADTRFKLEEGIAIGTGASGPIRQPRIEFVGTKPEMIKALEEVLGDIGLIKGQPEESGAITPEPDPRTKPEYAPGEEPLAADEAEMLEDKSRVEDSNVVAEVTLRVWAKDQEDAGILIQKLKELFK